MHFREVLHLIRPTQSPELNTIEHLWNILENNVRNRYPPQSPIQELGMVFDEEGTKITLETFQTLQEFVPNSRRHYYQRRHKNEFL